MKIFDVHSDMLYDLYTKQIQGKTNRFALYHAPQLRVSDIKGALWTMYSPDDFDLVEAIKLALSQLDMHLLPDFLVMLGLEGLRNLPNAEAIKQVYDLGIRHAMLTWNEENQYATGVAGDKNRGLMPNGKQLLTLMEQLDMIIDVAHLNEKSFYDVLNYTQKNIIFSHGNVKSICDHRRNLTDDQLKALREASGLFGLTLANNFVSSNKDEQNIDHLLNHLEKAIAIMDIDHVMFGFDFMDYLSDFPNSNISDLPDASKTSRLISKMLERGYREDEIQKLCFDNFYGRYKRHIHKFEVKS
ncbi:MAG: dipeptidase [Bacilli bacterium]